MNTVRSAIIIKKCNSTDLFRFIEKDQNPPIAFDKIHLYWENQPMAFRRKWLFGGDFGGNPPMLIP